MSMHLGWGSLLVALGSHSLVGEQNTHCPPGQLLCLARTVIILHTAWPLAVSNQVWTTVFPLQDLCSLLQSFSASSVLSFRGKGQTPCQTASCILFTLDIYTHFPVLTAVKTGPRCQEWAVGIHSLPYFPRSTGCSSLCFSGSGSSLDSCVSMVNSLIWQKLYCRSSGTCHLIVFCHRQATRVERGRWHFNLV